MSCCFTNDSMDIENHCFFNINLCIYIQRYCMDELAVSDLVESPNLIPLARGNSVIS
jgi:hypothetical protein